MIIELLLIVFFVEYCFVSLFFANSRISPGVCKWDRNRLQRNKEQIKNRKDVSEMGCKIPTQAQVCTCVS